MSKFPDEISAGILQVYQQEKGDSVCVCVCVCVSAVVTTSRKINTGV